MAKQKDNASAPPAASSGAVMQFRPPPGAEDKVDLRALLGEKTDRFSDFERRWIARAWLWADAAHAVQKRASGEPFVAHTVAAARTIVDLNLDWQAVCGALLHDAIEDTSTTYEDLKEEFPDPIADLVAGVTKISSLTIRSSHERQIENLRKMILAMARDIRVLLIKLADRLHNMETLDHLPPAKRKKIARSTMEIYAPLAGRLGIYRIKSALEDMGMRHLYPEEYARIKAGVALKKADREKHIHDSVAILSKELADHGIEATVQGRSKHFWSIFQKMRNQGLSFEDIYDLNALRVVCEDRRACYEILGLIHSLWKPVPDHFSDYVAMPKPNMYQSIHTKVIGLNGQLTEIQVRTQEMHRVAEEGIAAHWRYKEGKSAGQEMEKKLVWLRQMVEWFHDSTDPSEMLHDLKQDAFADKIFCFTPRGDVVEMNHDATVLDFAYRIHTDLGDRCTGAQVNHRFVPLRTRLRMGDLVEIETSKTPHPSPDWLNIVTSARARSKIRHALKIQNYQQNVQIGREMLMRALAKEGLRVAESDMTKALDLHMKGYRVSNVEDLFAEIGFGTIPTQAVVSQFKPPAEPPTRRRAATSDGPAAKKATVLVDGMPASMSRFAQCCKPKPGDPIAGLVTVGRGISIHHRDCRQLDRWLDQRPDQIGRFVRVSWAEAGTEPKRLTLRITARQRAGILHDVTEAISSMNLIIVSSNSKADLRIQRTVFRFTVLARSSENADALMERLRAVPDVDTVKQEIRPSRKSRKQ